MANFKQRKQDIFHFVLFPAPNGDILKIWTLFFFEQIKH